MPKGKRPPFIQIDTNFFLGLKDKKLEHADLWIIMLLKSRHNGYNNGNISLGLKDVMRECGLSKSTASRSLQRLQERGLIEKTYQGHTIVDELAVPSKWRLLFASDNQPAGWSHSGTHRTSPISEPNGGPISEPNGVVPFGNRYIDLDLFHEEENTHHSTHVPTRNIDG